MCGFKLRLNLHEFFIIIINKSRHFIVQKGLLLFKLWFGFKNELLDLINDPRYFSQRLCWTCNLFHNWLLYYDLAFFHVRSHLLINKLWKFQFLLEQISSMIFLFNIILKVQRFLIFSLIFRRRTWSPRFSWELWVAWKSFWRFYSFLFLGSLNSPSSWLFFIVLVLVFFYWI